MQGASNQLFTGAAVSENQYRGLARAHHFDKRTQLFDSDALADNFLRTDQRIVSRVIVINLLKVVFSSALAESLIPFKRTV